MANMTDPAIIKWSNEHVRVVAEKMWELDQAIQGLLTRYNAEIVGHADWTQASGTETLTDGRQPEGVSVLTKNDLINFVTQAQAYDTQLDGAGVRNVIHKPTVRF